MVSVFRVRTSQKEKRRTVNKIKKFISNILEFITIAFVYEEEAYNRWMNKVDRLRREDNE